MGVQFAGNILIQPNGGPLPISLGGTGQVTSAAARNALLPNQSGQAGKVLASDGVNVYWASTLLQTGGSDTQIQYNDSGALGGSANFVINKTTGALTATSTLTSAGLNINGSAGTSRDLKFKSVGNDRWLLRTNSTLETGANAGSNFELIAVADNGVIQTQVLTISRSTRVIDFKVTPTINGTPISTTVGTVTSIATTGSQGITVSGSPITSSGTISLGLGAITPTSVAATSTVTGSNLSGTNTGDQTITLTGDITGTGTGSFVTTLATVNASAQSNAFRKITVNGKGLTTATSAVTPSDITTALAYTPVNKAGDTMTGALILNADPTNALGAVTKQYADGIASGVNIHGACETATSAALAACTYNNGASGLGATLTANANGVLGTVGGYATLVVGSRVLVKNQVASLQNGIYTVTSLGSVGTPWVLTRATDFDGSPTYEISAGDLTYVQKGTNAGTQWVETAIGAGVPNDYIIIGTDAIVFTQFAGTGTYTAGTGINIATNTISNTGVLSNVAGAGISVSGATGNVTVTNTGVLSAAGTTNQVIVSAATGAVTFSLPQSINTGAAPVFTGTNFSSIPNGALTNSSTTINGTTIALGASGTVTAAAGTLTGTTLAAGVTASSLTSVGTLTSLSVTGAVTGASFNSITGLSSTLPAALGTAAVGTATTAARADHVHQIPTTVSGNAGTATSLAGGTINAIPYQSAVGTTAFLAQGTGVLQEVAGAPSWTTTPTLTGTNFSGIPNGALTNSSVTIGSTNVSLGSSATVITGLASVTSSSFVGTLTGNAATATTATTATTAGTVTTAAQPAITSVGTLTALAVSGDLSVGGNTVLGNASTDTLNVGNGGLIKDAAGNVGIGVTPSAWPAAASTLQMFNGSLSSLTGPYGQVNLTSNAYASGSPDIGFTTWRYVKGAPGNLGAAARYTMTGNQHMWYTAIPGTAGDPITFTQAMTLSTAGNLTITGSVNATSLNATSTIRVKKNVQNLGPSYLDRFNQLQPREYDRIDYDAHEFGFIAEEVDLIYPEVVGHDAAGLPSGIDYGKLSTILTAKIQEQQHTIQKLQEQMATVMKMLKAVK